MLVTDFDYRLPPELVAQHPLAERSASRLLRLDRQTGQMDDLLFRNLPDLVRPGDLMVFNNTRVFPARLFGRRSDLRAQPLSNHNPAARDFLQGRVEVLLTRQISADPNADDPDANEWECLVRPGRKIGVGEQIYFGDNHELTASVLARGNFGERRIRFEPVTDFFAILEKLGHVPLPPYISRQDSSIDQERIDRERYQTVYARERGSVAAPTAGLHFTAEILALLEARGVETAEITLHVGLGTFQPIHAENIEEHQLHAEAFNIAVAAADKINRALDQKRRVIAVGTTTVRTLEFAASKSGRVQPGRGEAELFIYPGFQFRVIGGLLTNFHLPQSTLLMLVCAFAGKDRVLAAYDHAVENKYRFYSYGDCMFVG